MNTTMKRISALLVAGLIALVAVVAFYSIDVSRAFADDDLAKLNAKVESTAKAYNNALKKLSDLEARIEANSKQIADLRAQIENSQAASDDAVRTMYMNQRSNNSLISVVTSTESLSDLLSNIEYYTRCEQANIDAIKTNSALKAELEVANTQLTKDKAEAEAALKDAEDALAEAQAAREAAMAAAIEDAAEQLAAEQAAGEVSTDEVVNKDEVEWVSPKDDFINTWAPRIDKYLEGSALEGYGEKFADCAWTYGVDPRWSPAIACIESAKGAECYHSYNAWGWNDQDFSSWDEAIEAHVSGLGKGYGATISIEAAYSYCPPHAEDWYAGVLSEMRSI